MRAVTVVPGKSGSARLAEVSEPAAEAGPILVQGLALGVCGTDLEIVAGGYGWPPAGRDWLILGHESLGRVLEAPAGDELSAGDLVVGIVRHPDPVPCPNCAVGEWDMCRNGQYTEWGIKEHHGYARERYRITPDFVVKVDPGLGDLGVLLEPTTVVAKAWDHIERIGARARWEPATVLITGAGPIGIMAAAVVRHAGARHVVITDVNPYRLELARKMGVTLALDVRTQRVADAQKQLGMKEGFDVGMEMSGKPPAMREMLGAMTHGGKVAMLGLPADEFAIDWSHVVVNMITIKGIYGREMFETWYAMSVLIEGGLDLAPVITGRYGYRDFEAAFDDAASGRGGKVILDWTS